MQSAHDIQDKDRIGQLTRAAPPVLGTEVVVAAAEVLTVEVESLAPVLVDVAGLEVEVEDFALEVEVEVEVEDGPGAIPS